MSFRSSSLLLLLAGILPAAAQPACQAIDGEYRRVVLVNAPPEPMRLAPLPDGRVLWTQRRGQVMIWRSDSSLAETALQLQVYMEEDNGLHGLVIDPAFASNHFVYVAYDPL